MLLMPAPGIFRWSWWMRVAPTSRSLMMAREWCIALGLSQARTTFGCVAPPPSIFHYLKENHSERALRTFTIGRKNWMTINTVRGANASATIYSVTETARANGLNVYYDMKHLLTELTQVVRADGSIDEKDLEPLMPWSKDLPAECYKRRK